MPDLCHCKLVHPKDLCKGEYSSIKSVYKDIEEWRDVVHFSNRKLFAAIRA